ncbi:MAG: TonB family protein [Candidatus Omnitrophica bacterium]|nr:TonB family protein [Candidatus Omnitrophota bacterium]
MKRQKSFLKIIVGFTIIVGFIACSYRFVFSSILDNLQGQENADTLRVIVGDLDSIWTKDLTRVAVANPAIADVVETKSSEILVLGKAPGKTEIYLWDKYGKRTITVWVFTEDLDLAQTRLTELLRSAGIKNVLLEKNNLEGKLVISGEIDAGDKDAFHAIIAPFAASLMNFVKEKEKRELVEIDVQIAEVSTSYTKNLGVEWPAYFDFAETAVPPHIKTFTDIFRIGHMGRTSTITATINAAIQEGKGKILSRPKIVTKSGEGASFLVGGQIPIRTTTISPGGNVEENIIFHDYGVNLNIKPTVVEDGKIDVDLKVDVSDIDAAHGTGGTYAYTSRSAQTKLFLDNGQTIILAGFMKDNKGQTVNRVPLAGSFPIFGFLFRNKNVTADDQTELFITLTPRVVATNEKRKEVIENLNDKVEAQKDKEQEITSSLSKTENEYQKPSYQPMAVPVYMRDYVKSVQERIAQNVVYPRAAREVKAQGTVELTLTIIKSGALAAASVNKSSGYVILDESALETVHRLSPYCAFSIDSPLREVVVTIPIVYQLN